jgi:hypothetical protein
MARYNTVSSTSTVGSATTINSPSQGLYTQFTGTAPYTAQLPSPVTYSGSQMAFYNNTSPAGIVTLSTVTNGGYIQGPGQPNATTTTYSLVAGATLIIFSDGVNFQLISLNGANTFVNNLTAAGTVSLTPANTTVTISPTGTGTIVMAPATLSSIDNVTIGGTTAADAKFNTLTLNTSLTGNGTISGGTF